MNTTRKKAAGKVANKDQSVGAKSSETRSLTQQATSNLTVRPCFLCQFKIKIGIANKVDE